MTTMDGSPEDLAKPMIGNLVYCERTRVISTSGAMIRVAESDAHDLYNGHDKACAGCFRYQACKNAVTSEAHGRW
jgi:hypothetical protein